MNITIFKGSEELNLINDNVDVEVLLDNGKRYAETFFNIENIISILDRYKKTKECCNGLYFWASDMIIVESLDENIINKTIQDLLKNEEFYTAFSLLE